MLLSHPGGGACGGPRPPGYQPPILAATPSLAQTLSAPQMHPEWTTCNSRVALPLTEATHAYLALEYTKLLAGTACYYSNGYDSVIRNKKNSSNYTIVATKHVRLPVRRSALVKADGGQVYGDVRRQCLVGACGQQRGVNTSGE